MGKGKGKGMGKGPAARAEPSIPPIDINNHHGRGMGKGKGKGMGKGPAARAEPSIPPIDINNPELVEELGLCDQANSLTLDNVLHSNLGGAGPDSGSADLTYSNVMPGTNLVVTAT